LVPALLDSVAIPLGFRRIQAANLVDWAADFTHVEFAKLVGAVSEILGGIPSPPPPPPAPAPRTIDLKTRVAEAEARDVADQSRLLLPSDADYWVRIGPGDYPFGEEGKRVKLAAFEIGRYPVTVWEYGKYLEQAGAARRPSGWEAQVLHPGRPVVNVSWHDAVKYCAWAKCGLPSEEQWEAAARGTEGRIYPWGSAEPDDRRANFNKLVGAPTPVGIFPEGNTPEGMADMAGNVWEWTASDYDKLAKVVRGACFDSRCFEAPRGVPPQEPA
jgi:formylglycine-generating enzyme required for sulfatase activity